MSFLKNQLVVDSKTNPEEKLYQDDHDKKSNCIRRPSARLPVQKSDSESNIRDFHLRGTYY